MIENYDDFIHELIAAGFSMANSGNDEGALSLLEYSWDNEPSDSPIQWHTGNAITDPWEWRMRVLYERDDIAYSKVFLRKNGYITKEWYPYFLAVRRPNKTFRETYSDGIINHYCKRIYEVAENDRLPIHDLKHLAGFKREDNAKFDRAITELQMRLFLTVCGSQRKISKTGEGYGWASTIICTTESFWGEEVFEMADSIDTDQAINKIAEQIFKYNPAAENKKAEKFIRG